MTTRLLWYALMMGSTLVPCRAQFLGSTPSVSAHMSPGIDDAVLKSLLNATRPPIKFRPDDIISVQVYGVKDYTVQQRIAEDGTVRFPLLGIVQVAGLSVQELEQTLSTLLRTRGIVTEPEVTVTAVAQPWAIVTISGEVGKPGVYPAFGNLTLMDYLSQAGGILDVLSYSPANSPASSVVTLIRPGFGEPVNIPLGSDAAHSPYARIPLFPGDEIRVGKVGFVYAVGALRSQGAFPLKNASPTTILQLVAMAGGIGYEGDKRDVFIIRTDGSSKYVIQVDLGKILKGKMADLALKSDDVLYVPTNGLRAAIKGGGSGLVVTLATALIYEHP